MDDTGTELRSTSMEFAWLYTAHKSHGSVPAIFEIGVELSLGCLRENRG